MLCVLNIEDSEDDATLIQHALAEGGYELVFKRIDTAVAMRSALKESAWDCVVSDYKLPQFSGMEALSLLRETALDIPFIIVSGAIGEETAMEAMKAGAHDYIMKGHLQRLVPAVERELQEKIVREERRKILDELKASKAQLSNALEIANLGHWVYDVPGDLFTFNDQFYKLFGTTAEKIGGYTMKSAEYARRFVYPDDIDIVVRETQKAIDTTDPHFSRQIEHRMLYEDGTVGDLAVRFYIVKNAEGETVKTYGVNQDITEHKKVERLLRESEQKYRLITETIADVVWTSDLALNLTYISPSAEKMYGESAKIHICRPPEERCPAKSLAQFRVVLSEELEKEKDPRVDKARSRLLETECLRADGSAFWVSMNIAFIRDGMGTIIGLHGVSRDISEQKRNEEEILRNEARLEGLLRIAQHKAKSIQSLLDFALEEAIELTDSVLGYIYLYDDQSKEFTLNTWSKEVMKECSIRDAPLIYQLESTGIWGEAVRQAKPIIVNDFQSPHPLKKGYPEGHAPIRKYLTVPVFSGDKIVAVAGVANKPVDYNSSDVRQLTLLMDSVWRILEAKRLTEELFRTEGKYRNIFDNAQEGIFQTDKAGQFVTANNAMATMLGYKSPKALISSIKNMARGIYVDPKAREKLLKEIDEQGAVKSFICQYRRKDKKVIWVSIDQHAVRDDQGKILHYEGFCEDITDRQMSTERLREALGATIQAISATVEARDPYTAGHQSRVSNLVQSIALEMGLPEDRIEGLRLAASIHDLGKVSVPAEILTKPNKLLAIEFELIKIHAQAGYDILKDIEFPWPIARIVLEHHERMDGSGYPNRLSGDQMLVESRILAVADVVEAMASYRPSRPALGIDAALAEIEKNRGILYDSEVVDSCLRLFREKGFILEESR
jgi:PAS domain S-box-containing protein